MDSKNFIINDTSYQEYESMLLQLRHYDMRYYRDSISEISDTEYDKLRFYILAIEEKYPKYKLQFLEEHEEGIDMIGYTPTNNKMTHKIPMLSLDNAFNFNELKQFFAKSTRYLNLLDSQELLPIVCEPKIDGVSFSAHYKNHKLNYAVTRGNGYVGEDITYNISHILPSSLHEIYDCGSNETNQKFYFTDIEIRGEIYISKSNFLAINKAQEKSQETIYKTARNLASGSLKLQNIETIRKRHLEYFAYDIPNFQTDTDIKNSKLLNMSQASNLKILSLLGFHTNNYNKYCVSFDEILDHYNYILSIRNDIDYEVDGMVCKINDHTLRQNLGHVGKTPRYAVAYKLPSPNVETTLENVEYSLGRTGVITPVGILKPVHIGGVTVSRVTLHNFEEIQKRNLHIGDTIYIQRSGDVIPKITGVNEALRMVGSQKILAPTHCPNCNTQLVQEKIKIACPNIVCSERIIDQILHFASKSAMNIEGLSIAHIRFFYKENIISQYSDIYKLGDHKEWILNQDGFGQKSFDNLMNAILQSRNISASRFLYALGIKTLGEKSCNAIARKMENIQDILNEEFVKSLIEIESFGESAIFEILQYFAEDYYRNQFLDLLPLLNIEFEKLVDNIGAPLLGKKIVFTGKLTSLSRNAAKKEVERLGGSVLTAISPNVNFLIAGEKAGSKLVKARELNIQIFSENEWREWLKTIT